MKAKIIKIIIGSTIMIMVAILLIIAYLMLVDIETKMPNKNTYTCNIDTRKFMGRNIFIITPKTLEKSDIKILYFHGGSYMAEATKEHWAFLERLVNDTGATVIMPDYPLTPKYNYEDVFRMVVPLYKEIIEKVNTNQLVIMGDSAGGGLSLALEEKLSKEDVEMPNKTILISPWLDVRLENEKIEKVEKLDKQLNKEALKIAGIAYAGENGINSYLVNPIDGDLSKLKNVTIYTGTYDILNPDVHILMKKAKEQNINIEVKEYEKASHIWIIQNKAEEKDLVEKAYNDILVNLKEE